MQCAIVLPYEIVETNHVCVILSHQVSTLYFHFICMCVCVCVYFFLQFLQEGHENAKTSINFANICIFMLYYWHWKETELTAHCKNWSHFVLIDTPSFHFNGLSWIELNRIYILICDPQNKWSKTWRNSHVIMLEILNRLKYIVPLSWPSFVYIDSIINGIEATISNFLSRDKLRKHMKDYI